MLRTLIITAFIVGGGAFGLIDASNAQGWDPRTAEANVSKIVRRSNEALDAFKAADPSLDIFFEKAYGYAVFPRITKGGFGIGGARGRGVAYKGGVPDKKAYLTQATIGAQFGGKQYRELIFFRDADAYLDFISGDFEFSAQATAVIATDGAGATADYDDGVAVFTLEKVGAFFEASLGGQKFSIRELK